MSFDNSTRGGQPPHRKEFMKYRIIFTDAYGQGQIECDGGAFDEIMTNLCNDPNVEGLWVESYDPEEGWQS